MGDACPRCVAMHRRAQEAESKAARAWRQNDIDRLWLTVAYLRDWAEREALRTAYWKRLYREAMTPWWRVIFPRGRRIVAVRRSPQATEKDK